MIRRPLTVMLALGLAAATAGCTTFSDSDNVARVGDVAWSTDDFQARLLDLGATKDVPLPADAVRGVLTEWINEQVAGVSVDDAELAPRYDQGMNASGVMCLQVLVVEDEDTGAAVRDEIVAGLPFTDAVAAYNIDGQVAQSGGLLPCVGAADVEGATEVPFIAMAMALTADDDPNIAPLQDTDGNDLAWVVARLRPFTELTGDDLPFVRSTLIADTVDVRVDPRYGTFDRTTLQVVPLG